MYILAYRPLSSKTAANDQYSDPVVGQNSGNPMAVVGEISDVQTNL